MWTDSVARKSHRRLILFSSQQMSFCSSAKTFPHRDGTLQEYMNHPVDFLYK